MDVELNEAGSDIYIIVTSKMKHERLLACPKSLYFSDPQPPGLLKSRTPWGPELSRNHSVVLIKTPHRGGKLACLPVVHRGG